MVDMRKGEQKNASMLVENMAMEKYVQLLKYAEENNLDGLLEIFEEVINDEKFIASVQELSDRNFDAKITEQEFLLGEFRKLVAELRKLKQQAAQETEDGKKKIEAVIRKKMQEYANDLIATKQKELLAALAELRKHREELKANEDKDNRDALHFIDVMSDVAAILNDASLAFAEFCLYSSAGGPSISGAIPSHEFIQDTLFEVGITEVYCIFTCTIDAIHAGARGEYTRMAQGIGNAISSLGSAVVCIGNKFDLGTDPDSSNQITFPALFALSAAVSLLPIAVKLCKGDWRDIDLATEVVPFLFNSLKVLAVMVSNGILASNPFGWMILGSVTLINRIFALDQTHGSGKGWGAQKAEQEESHVELAPKTQLRTPLLTPGQSSEG